MQNTPTLGAGEKAHPFELSGLGVGPFKFIDIVKHVTEHGQPAGTCQHCGNGIMWECIISDRTGKTFVVGNQCVEKTGDKFLGNAAKVALAVKQREARYQREHAKQRARQEKWLAEVCNERGETNAQRQAREHAEHLAAEEAAKAAVVAKFAFFLPHVEGAQYSSFKWNICEGIKAGCAPTGRGLNICAEIYAKSFGRYGSKGFTAAYDEFWAKIDTEEAQ